MMGESLRVLRIHDSRWTCSLHQTGMANDIPLCAGLVLSGGLARDKIAGIITFMMSDEPLQLLLAREMPYGKYKGRLIADLPGHYLGWFAREGFPPGELGRLLALMYELDHNALRHLLDPLRRK